MPYAYGKFSFHLFPPHDLIWYILYDTVCNTLNTMYIVSDLPMTIRSCFYPILGDRIYGNVGDLIDILSVVSTMFGVCTTLGLGVMQLNAGFNRITEYIPVNATSQIIIIWCITAIATASVVSGLKVGIRHLSEVCFGLGMFIMLVLFFTDDTRYFLNLYVQSIGYYVQNAIQVGFHTDAFAQLNNAPDDKEDPNWMNSWTVFYWGWWISVCPFVGMFIAKISKGRTLGEFIKFNLTIPVLYTFVWLSIFGGAGLKMERNAEIANITCNSTFGGELSTKSLNGLYRLSCRSANDQWFDVMNSYEGLGFFLSILSLIGIILYFVTTSDSGSLVIDILSANGHQDPPVLQRIFWALTEGACATALLVAGGTDALKAMQTVSISSGLPSAIMLCIMCLSLWKAIKSETSTIGEDVAQFTINLLDAFDSLRMFVKFLIAFFIPWYFLGYASKKISKRGAVHTIIMALLHYSAIILVILQLILPNLAYVGLTVYIGFVAYCTSIRLEIRQHFSISGNIIEDFFASFFMYPCVAVQVYKHVRQIDKRNRNTGLTSLGPGSEAIL